MDYETPSDGRKEKNNSGRFLRSGLAAISLAVPLIAFPGVSNNAYAENPFRQIGVTIGRFIRSCDYVKPGETNRYGITCGVSTFDKQGDGNGGQGGNDNNGGHSETGGGDQSGGPGADSAR